MGPKQVTPAPDINFPKGTKDGWEINPGEDQIQRLILEEENIELYIILWRRIKVSSFYRTLAEFRNNISFAGMSPVFARLSLVKNSFEGEYEYGTLVEWNGRAESKFSKIDLFLCYIVHHKYRIHCSN